MRANLHCIMQALMVSPQIEDKLVDIKAELPLGISVETSEAVEMSAKGDASFAKGESLFLVAVLTLLTL